MSDSFVNPIFGEREEPSTRVEERVEDLAEDRAEPEGTGDHGVDAVVASMNGLDDLPVADHVAVFEQAHETLRRALAGARREDPAAGRG